MENSPIVQINCIRLLEGTDVVENVKTVKLFFYNLTDVFFVTVNSSRFSIPCYKKDFYNEIQVLHLLSIFNFASQSISYLHKLVKFHFNMSDDLF